MSLLKDLANRAMTVKVGGKPVHLRYPLPEQRMEMYRKLQSVDQTGTEEGNVVAANVMNQITADCLAATVCDHEDMLSEDWARLVAASNHNPDEYKGLADLVVAAMKLCGYKGFLKDGEDGATDGAIDHAKEVEAVIGDNPT